MKKLIALMMVAMFVTVFAAEKATEKSAPKAKAKTEAMVCPGSEVYHVSKECSALQKCSGKVENMTIKEAKEKKLRHCKANGPCADELEAEEAKPAPKTEKKKEESKSSKSK